MSQKMNVSTGHLFDNRIGILSVQSIV